jgi:hypothetical protein
MTIYNFVLNNDNLSRIPSTQDIVDLCLYISIGILEHLSDRLKFDCRLRQHKVKHQINMLQRHICEVGEQAYSYPGTSYPVVTHVICYERLPDSGDSGYKLYFTMKSLKNVPLRILTEVSAHMLFYGATSLINRNHSHSIMDLNKCISEIGLIIYDLLKTWHLPRCSCNYGTASSIKMKVEFKDNIRETINFD